MKISTSKVVLFSESKTTISEFVKRIPGRVYTDNTTSQTLGADFTISEREDGDKAIHLYIWVVNNHPSFSLLREYYLHGTRIYIMFIDASKSDSIQQVAAWKAEADKAVEKAPGVIVATNIDRVPEHAKVEDTIGELARELGLEAMLVSTETEEDYTHAIKKILERVDRTAMASCT